MCVALATLTAALLGAPPQDAGDGLKGEYFARAGGMLQGAPVLTRVDPRIDFSWGMAAPDPAVGVDDFAVRWTGFIRVPLSATYTFTALIDDGARIWIDDVLVLDDWVPDYPREKSGNAVLEAGKAHRIRMEYWEQGGGATIRFFWSALTLPKQLVPTSALYSRGPDAGPGTPAPAATQESGDGLKGEYFAKAGRLMVGTPVLTRIDPAIDFEWGGGGPDPAVGTDDFAVRWTGWIKAPASETYEFHTQQDDGMRVWIDDALVIDGWAGPGDRSGKARLAAGHSHKIRVEFFEGGVAARARLLWSSPAMPQQVVPKSVLYSASTRSELAPVPSTADEKKVLAVVKDLYKKEYAARSADDRRALAQELLQKGLESTDDPMTRFVMLREARDLAAGAGDLATALRACDALGASHAIDVVPFKIAALEKSRGSAVTVDALRALGERLLALAEEAMEADRYDDALDCLKKAQGAGKDPALEIVAGRAREREKRVAELKREWQKVEAAAKTLKEKPDDPAANLAVGRFLCFEKDDWERGAGHLAKGADAALKTLAELESARPRDAGDQSALGDEWWTFSEKEKGADRKRKAQFRAAFWYAKAVPQLAGTARLRTEKRLDQIALLKYPPGAEIGTEGQEALWALTGNQASKAPFAVEAGAAEGKLSLKAHVDPYDGGLATFVFPREHDLSRDVTKARSLVFRIKCSNPNDFGWQGTYPMVTLYESETKFLQLRPAQNLIDVKPDGWKAIEVPLAPDVKWTKVAGDPVRRVNWVSIGVDSWGNNPITVWIDGLNFK